MGVSVETATIPDRTDVSSDAEENGEEGFKRAFRRHPAGVAVITLVGSRGPVGFTATSVTSVSAVPPVLSFSLAARSSSRPALEKATSVVINFLAAEQHHIATRFARHGVDRFSGVAWTRLPTGEPVLDDTSAWLHGDIEQRIPVGESLLVTVGVRRAHHHPGRHPLVYVDRTYHRLGDHSRLT